MRSRCFFIGVCLMLLWTISPICAVASVDNHSFVTNKGDGFVWIKDGKAAPILVDAAEDKGVLRAVENLAVDAEKVTGVKPFINQQAKEKRLLIIGSVQHSGWIKQLVKAGKIKGADLQNKREKYILQTIEKPFEGVNEAVVIAGSDKRGSIYGIYELSAQMGVSPWYYWADVPVQRQSVVGIRSGVYTEGEPAVRYRGIFLNDEWPCLGEWAKDAMGGLNSKLYEKIFELVLRLKGNYMWPAMWASAFYDDDAASGPLANEMGIVMGTSHHEPMGLAQQDWKRRGKGAWNYATNGEVLRDFWTKGMQRCKDWESVITVGMRGDGDEAMGEGTNISLLQRIIKDQRKIITKVTGKNAKETPQVWALYKEVMDYYDKGMRVPDDVTLLLCDDNWGNVRRLPNPEERKRPGGWGMYYHVDYVGAPRNTKWLNVTPIQNMWEQLTLTYDYGVDRIWILNVGDLKPMEYPITLFMDMAWNPKKYTEDNLLDHARRFCAQQFGEEQAEEAMRILNLYSKYNGRVTAEMLDCKTYNLESGEWQKVTDAYLKLEAEALRQYITLDAAYKDAYKQLILFPVQAMANLYEMYYAQAMNHRLFAENNPQANEWADKVEQAFKRDGALCDDYNLVMAGGKWNKMMRQKHIGYTNWNDNFPADKMPEVYRVTNEDVRGNYVFTGKQGYVSMEAAHFHHAKASVGTKWTVIPYLGRTLSGVTLMPYTQPVEGAEISYQMQIPSEVTAARVHVVLKSTLAFQAPEGHKFSIGFEGGEEKTINFNGELNERSENVYTKFYPTVARRVIEKTVELSVPSGEGLKTLTFKPLHPATVLEKIVVDYGGYQDSYLFMDESPCKRM